MLRFDALNFAELVALDPHGGGAPRAQLDHIKSWLGKNEPKVFEVKAAKADELELTIMGVIGGGWYFGGVSATDVKAALDENKSAKSIRVLMDSPGGDYFDGVAIMNLLRRHPANVTVEVIGEATSAGSVVAMGADRVEMRPGTMMMIHRAWTFAMGNGDEIRGSADLLDKVDSGLLDVYVARTGKDREELSALVAATTWMSPADAVERGFAEEALPIDAKPTNQRAKTEPAKPAAPADRAPAQAPRVATLNQPSGFASLRHSGITSDIHRS